MPSIVPEITLTLDRRRTLRLDNRAILTAERELSRLWGTKVSLFQTLASAETLGFNDLTVLLWQALLHEDKTLTLAQVQDLVDFRQLTPLITAVLEAWNVATAPAEPRSQDAEAPETDDPLASPSLGERSGVMLVSN
jgi:hypothetical protein